MWQSITTGWLFRLVSNAYEAVDYLSGFGSYADRTRFPLPDVLLIGLSAQTDQGLDLLAWLRGQKLFSHLSVVVLNAPETDARAARELAPQAWFAEIADLRVGVDLCGQALMPPLSGPRSMKRSRVAPMEALAA